MKIKRMKRTGFFCAIIACVLLCAGFLRPFEYAARAEKDTGQGTQEPEGQTAGVKDTETAVYSLKYLGIDIAAPVRLLELKDAWFGISPYVYIPELSELSSLLAMLCYSNHEGDPGVIKTADGELIINDFMEMLGFSDVEAISVPKDAGKLEIHRTEIFVGHKALDAGRELLAVMIRGTNGTVAEWASNFDLGTESIDQKEWTDTEHHAGFDITAKNVEAAVDEYAEEHIKGEAVYWISGHSRGAAVANITAADYVDAGREVRAYTFATPGTTLDGAYADEKYKCIFNILNNDDLVPRVPLESWGYKLYGQTAVKNVSDALKKNYENSLSKDGKPCVYDGDAESLGSLMEAMAKLLPDTGDPVKAVFELGCSHITGVPGSGISVRMKNADAEKLYAALPQRVQRSGHVAADESDEKYSYVCITPAGLVQCLASMMSDDLSAGDKLLLWQFFAKSETLQDIFDAMQKMTESDKVTAPHMPYTYYLLSRETNVMDFLALPVPPSEGEKESTDTEEEGQTVPGEGKEENKGENDKEESGEKGKETEGDKEKTSGPENDGEDTVGANAENGNEEKSEKSDSTAALLLIPVAIVIAAVSGFLILRHRRKKI